MTHRAPLIAALSLALAAVCFAPAPTCARPAEEARLQALLDQATEDFRSQRYEAALRGFTEVAESGVEVVPLAQTRRNIGRCLEKLGRYEDARVAFEKALTVTAGPTRKLELKRLIEKMDLLIYGGIDIRCQPEGVTLELVDRAGKVVREGPCPVTWAGLPRGAYFLDGRLPSDPPGPGRRWIDDPLRRATVQIAGRRIEVSTLVFPGALTVDAPPGSSIYVDEVERTSPVTLEAGPHIVRIEAPRRTPWQSRFVMPAGEVISVRLPDAAVTEVAPPAPEGPRLGPWLVGGTAVLAGVAAGVLGISQHDLATKAEAIYQQDYVGDDRDPDAVALARREVEDRVDQARTLELAGWVTGGVALALTAVTVIMVLTEEPSAEASSAVPSVAPGALIWTW